MWLSHSLRMAEMLRLNPPYTPTEFEVYGERNYGGPVDVLLTDGSWKEAHYDAPLWVVGRGATRFTWIPNINVAGWEVPSDLSPGPTRRNITGDWQRCRGLV